MNAIRHVYDYQYVFQRVRFALSSSRSEDGAVVSIRSPPIFWSTD